MKNKETRKKEALERDAAYKALSTPQKVIKLDLKLGGNMGAKRQRTRLTAKILEESNNNTVVTEPKKESKPYQKPKKS